MPYWRLSGVYFAYFAVVGALFPFWGLYLQELGYGPQDIGILIAIPMVTKLIAPNLWGWLTHKVGKPLLIIRLGALGTCIGFLGVVGQSEFVWLSVFIFLYSFFWNAVLPQYEVVTLEYLGTKPYLYSRIRLWGSVGFIFAVMALGLLFEVIAVGWLGHFVLAAFIFLLLFSCTLPPLKEVHESEAGAGFFTELKSAPVIMFFVVLFLLQFSHGTYYTFYSIYLQNYNYSMTVIGALWSLGVIAEIVLFLFMPRLLAHTSLYSLMGVSLLLTAIRWLFIGCFPESTVVVWGAQILHAASFGVTHAVAIEFIRRYFSRFAQGQAQAFYSAVGFGGGGALGAILSGELWVVSPFVAFFSSFVIALLASIISFVCLKKVLSS